MRATHLTLAPLLAATLAFAGELDFWRENIAVRITACDTIEVTGDYFFRSPGTAPLTIGLYYPVPVDSLSDFPARITARAGDSTRVAHTHSGSGVTFPVTVPESGVCSVRVCYTQHVRQCAGRYILTTTSAWGKPLGPSNYSVALPSGMTLTHLSYEADSAASAGGWTVYRFFRDNFMPTQDLAFTWEAPCCGKASDSTAKRARGKRERVRR